MQLARAVTLPLTGSGLSSPPATIFFMPKVAFFCLMSACQLSVISRYRWNFLVEQKAKSVVGWLGALAHLARRLGVSMT